jgi:hypothetical protein
MNADPRAIKWTRREGLGMLGRGVAAAALPRPRQGGIAVNLKRGLYSAGPL